MRLDFHRRATFTNRFCFARARGEAGKRFSDPGPEDLKKFSGPGFCLGGTVWQKAAAGIG
ncbi:MAG: hypothetical protein C4325_07125 [Blastocatellia bacterium]